MNIGNLSYTPAGHASCGAAGFMAKMVRTVRLPTQRMARSSFVRYGIKESALAPVVIVLAAGHGRRFARSGGIGSKLDAVLHGRTVLAHVLDAVQASGLHHHVVNAQQGGPGMADSIAAGVQAVPNASAWLVLPADLPLLQAKTIQQVAQALLDGAPFGIKAVVPRHGGQRGHPVAFDASCYALLSQLSGEQGAASVIHHLRSCGQVQDLDIDDAGAVMDVDTIEDLDRRAQWPASSLARP